MANLLLIVAAGSGTRLGRAEPKALVPLAGRPLLSWTLASLASAGFTRTVVAAPPDRLEDFRGVVAGGVQVVAGGETPLGLGARRIRRPVALRTRTSSRSTTRPARS